MAPLHKSTRFVRLPRERLDRHGRRISRRLLAEHLEGRQLLATNPFATAPSYLVGQFPQGAVAADFTGDGTLDVATANYDAGTVSVLRGMTTERHSTRAVNPGPVGVPRGVDGAISTRGLFRIRLAFHDDAQVRTYA